MNKVIISGTIELQPAEMTNHKSIVRVRLYNEDVIDIFYDHSNNYLLSVGDVVTLIGHVEGIKGESKNHASVIFIDDIEFDTKALATA